jgi:hypothetical protein
MEVDKIVEEVVEKFRQRSEAGQRKYGTTLMREDVDFAIWLNHLQEELMDSILYIQRLKKDI